MRLWGVVRVAALALAGAWVIILADRYSHVIHNWVGPKEPPTETAALPLGGEILRQSEARRIREVNEEYASVKARLEAAKARGLDVSRLEPLLVHALAFARAKRYDHSLALLNRIGVGVPRARERVIAARADDPPPSEPAIPSRPTARQPPRSSRTGRPAP
ncbi:MAG: hypothetical protein HY554_18040 [Elusimicrobia bacterium]|nr:hypothetical protein [Elusimicrobiota bacterium]